LLEFKNDFKPKRFEYKIKITKDEILSDSNYKGTNGIY